MAYAAVPVLFSLAADPIRAQQSVTTGDQSPSVIAGGNVAITYGTMSPEEREAFAKQLADKLIEQMKATGVAPASPNAEQRVGEAVAAIAKGASEGDGRLQKALDLLAKGDAAQATPLLQSVADEKTARIDKDRKEAATAYRNLGAIAGLRDPRRALLAYRKAADLDPDDAQSLLLAGLIEVDYGDLGSAETRLGRVLQAAVRPDWQFWAAIGLADIEVQRGDLGMALGSYRAQLAIATRLARSGGGNAAGWQRNQSVSDDRIGDVLMVQGDLPGALTSYRDSRALRASLAQSDPGNAEAQRELSVSDNRIGDVLMAQGDIAGALTAYRAGHAVAVRLAASDPGHAEWQRDLSISDERLGASLVAQGNLAEALTSYRESRAIRERLASSDPGNAEWQRDLSVSENRVGEILVGQGDLAGALASYQHSRAIRARLAQSDPGNAGWQRDLSVSDGNIFDVLAARGDIAGALASYDDSRAIRRRLAQSDPGNTEWQRDYAVSFERIGGVHGMRGEASEAVASYEAALGIYQDLERRNPDDVQSRLFSVVPLQQLGHLKGKAGRADLEAALGVLTTLEAADRLDAMHRSWIEPMQTELAALPR